MTPLETAGRALFGSAWQVAMAKALDVNERTVRRWHAGDSNVPYQMESGRNSKSC